jgi:hypothetical protein
MIAHLTASLVGMILFLASFEPDDPAVGRAFFAVIYFYLLGRWHQTIRTRSGRDPNSEEKK